MNAREEINCIVKSSASTVVWPSAMPSADTERGKFSIFQKLIKTINGSYPDNLYYRDKDLIRKGWRESNGYLYEPAKDWMLRMMPHNVHATASATGGEKGDISMSVSRATKNKNRDQGRNRAINP